MLRKALISCLFLCVIHLFGGLDLHAQENREYVIKASWLYQFTKFIEWPVPYVDEDNFTIGVFDNDEDMLPQLEELVEFKRAKNRMIIIKQFSAKSIPNANELEYCDMFFISKKNRALEDKIIEISDKSNTLLIGETKKFAHRGGSIGFYINNNNINLYMNREIVEKATYKIDPELLRSSNIISPNDK